MADQKLSQLQLATALAAGDEMYIVQSSTGKRAPLSLLPVSTAQADAIALKLDKADLSTETDLGTNGTALDATNRYHLRFKGAYTSNQTLTLSNVSKLNNFKARITNTNANTITFSGITLYFKTDDLPDGVSFASNALTFPADSAVPYNLVGELFDGVFDCKIEIR